MKENVDLWYVQTDIKVAQSRAILQGGTKSFDQNTLQKKGYFGKGKSAFKSSGRGIRNMIWDGLIVPKHV